jgi:protein-disulfide isomerase
LVPVLEQVLEKYPHDVKVVYKNFPLSSHNFAMKAAVAAMAAGSQGKFWEFYDLLYKNYNRLNDEKIQEIALAVGLNREEFEKKKNDPAIARQIRQDISDGEQAGVRGTPTVFINGIRLKNRSLEGFQEAVDNQLEKLGKTAGKPSS